MSSEAGKHTAIIIDRLRGAMRISILDIAAPDLDAPHE